MKIVHLTDIHVQCLPPVRELRGKRLLGTVNLYVLGRKSKFDPVVQRAAVQATLREAPDLIIVSGDLTAQALENEFAEAHDLLEPLLSRFPTVMIPGNHDTYIREPSVGEAMRKVFGQWTGPSLPQLHDHDPVAVLTLETCRPNPLSAGYTPPEQLEEAHRLLEGCPDRFIFLCIHYPLRDRNGQPYGPSTRALANANMVEDFLKQQDRIDAVLHGHEHHGYRTTLMTGKGEIPSLNPGSSGYAHMPKRRRTAHFNVYQADQRGLHDVRRLAFDGEVFREEVGGAYATGG